ncbi:MAG: Hsp70 family protein [Pseudonocardiaceae bacterium]
MPPHTSPKEEPTTPFGIDLGTTHSCIAYLDAVSGRPVVVPSAIGEDTTPSVVYFEGRDQAIVGNAAKRSAVLAPHLIAQLIKREMGRRDVVAEYHGQKYPPEKISALILRELVRATEEHTKLAVREVVITVPAYFGIAEREATRKAGEIAGLTVLDVLAEPVAAALHYQALHTQDPRADQGTRHLLVCDLGGGTFDTTVIRVDGDDVRVICTDGDPRLGGADWDERIREHLIAGFTAQHPRLDPTADEDFIQGLGGTAEQLKKDLSRAESRRTDLRFAGAVARLELTRQTLEELTADLLDRVVAITERTITFARRKGVTRFDDVVLVGGMTKMPAVARLLAERLGLEARLHEPDLAVAKGAALFARIWQTRQAVLAASGGISRTAAENAADHLGMSVEQVEAMAAKKVTTVVPRAFGIKVTDPRDPLFRTDPLAARQMIAHLLRANTPLPADTGPYPFAIGFENQRMVEIEVWEQQGAAESDELSHNTMIGKGMMTGLPPRRPAGSPFEVTFFMSETGTLTVYASEPDSGVELTFDLQIGGMDRAAVDAARTSIAKHEVTG